jgi:enoyl-CoA hydratase/carnithine racemase
MHLRREDEGGVWVLVLDDGRENRFTETWFAEFHEALDTLEAAEGPTSLVLAGPGPAGVAGSEAKFKFFSNGFDVAWLTNERTQGDALASLHRLLARLLSFGIPTVCCITGHAFAGGAMLALACDYRVMNQDRGFFCTNELDLGFPFTDGMMALFSLKVPLHARTPLLLGASRLTAERCEAMGLINSAVPAAGVMQAALEVAKRQAAKGSRPMRALYRSTKEQLHAGPLSVLRAAAVQSSPGAAPLHIAKL